MEQNSIWKNIPVDILEQIMKHLPHREYLALRAICYPWWISVSNVMAKDNCHPLTELPLVLLRNEDSMFYSLSTESLHRPKTQLLKRTQFCHGSFEGWLIMGDYTVYTVEGFATFFFLNPVTNVRIMIPSKLYFPSNSLLYVEKMVASSKPGSDCYLAGLLDDFCHIAIYKPFDNSWTIIEPDKDSGIYFVEVEIIGTKLYVTTDKTSQSILLVYDLKDWTNGPPKAEMLAKLPKLRPLVSSISGNHCIEIDHTICYLAKDEVSRELYLIYMICNVEYTTLHNYVLTYVEPPEVTTIEVYKLDMNKEPIGWQSVRLDDRVAFVSSCKSMVMSRDKLNYSKELIRGNSIYFGFILKCIVNPWLGLKLGMFCLNDSSIKYFPLKTSNHCCAPDPVWFVPSLW
ncbi:uncharacterized protein [Cicer arietinum]|uniref:Uncharacterized protein LOC101501983 n=1 Tax=Cicer arietinum TaxID=3827 RepID=A0A1S2XPE4_CICAR|nr:uncharacterized protein LOC101501983 [Cicer arietinum]